MVIETKDEKKEEKKTEPVQIELPEEKVEDEPLTEAEMKELGLNKDEIESAKKFHMAKEIESKKKEEKKSDEKVQETKGEEIKKEAGKDLSDEEEHTLLTKYNANEKALYWKAKNERKKRQDVENERDHEVIKRKAAEREIENLKKGVPEEKKTEEEEAELKDDDLLTVKEFKRMQEKEKRQKAELEADKQKIAQENAVKIHEKLNYYGEKAKKEYENFDETVELATELMNNVDTIFSDKRKKNEEDGEYEQRRSKNIKMRAKVRNAVQNWYLAVANCLNSNDDSYTPADIAVEIGMMHPKYGKKDEDDGEENVDAKDDKKTERAIENAGRRTSSAAVGGSVSKRVISADELTLEQAARLTPEQFRRLPKEAIERLKRTGG